MEIEPTARLRERALVWRLRYERALRLTHRLASKPDLSIFGCYDAGNVGDLALGRTIDGIARRLARTAFDSPGSSRRLLPPRAVVLGGGGVVTSRPKSPLIAFAEYARKRPCVVSVVGVSALLRDAHLPDPALSVLQRAAWISARSRSSADELSRALGRSDVVVQPDITFALRLSQPAFDPPERRRRRVLLNVSPFLHSAGSRGFVAHTKPSDWFRAQLPEQAAWFERIGPSYVELMTEIAARFVARGWEVATIPLAPEDDLFARSMLRDARIHHLPFSSNPVDALRHLGRAERAFATRFHAHVFCLLAGTPFGSLAYSPKCSDLFADLGLPSRAQAQPADWVHQLSNTLERLMGDDATAALSVQERQDLEMRTYDITRRGILAALDDA